MTGVINYLLCQTGVNDVQTKAREQILNADMEMSDELIHKAMSDGEKLGFTAEIPESEKFQITNEVAGIAGLPALPSSTTGLTQTPMQQSGSTQLEAMMSLLKKITDPDGAAAEEKAREDAANAAAARQKAEGELAKQRENTLAREKAEAKKAEEKKAEEKKAEEKLAEEKAEAKNGAETTGGESAPGAVQMTINMGGPERICRLDIGLRPYPARTLACGLACGSKHAFLSILVSSFYVFIFF